MCYYYAVNTLFDAFGNFLGEFAPVFLGEVFAVNTINDFCINSGDVSEFWDYSIEVAG